MTRYRFGGDAAAWVVDALDGSSQFGAGQQIVGLPVSDTQVHLFSAAGGSEVTDFLTYPGGGAITSIVVPAGTPYLPMFDGPDGVLELWFQDAAGNWRVLQPSDLGLRMGNAEGLINDIIATGGGGGGGGVAEVDRRVFQIVAGSLGYPARPDPTDSLPWTWWGPDQPPIGTVSGSVYMRPLDVWKRTDQIVATS